MFKKKQTFVSNCDTKKENNSKVFAVISLGFLGDTILTEALCKNIRNNFPNSKIVFVVDKIFADIPKGFPSVDEIIEYDKKNSHSGLLGYLKLKKEISNKKVDYAIITHPHERSVIIAKILNSKKIISLPVKKSLLNFLITHKREYIENEIRNTYKVNYNNGYLKSICNIQNIPAKYIRADIIDTDILNKFQLPEKYVVLSPISKDLIKDWDYDNVKEFILNLKEKVVLVGTEKAKSISLKLQNEGVDFVDLSMKTTISELATIIKNSQFCVSVDTGTLHLSYVQGVKTIGIFFSEAMVKEWTPDDIENLKILIGEKVKYKNNIKCIKNVLAKDVISKMNLMVKENIE